MGPEPKMMSGSSTKPVMQTRLIRRLRSLRRDRKGATIIEFAAVAAPFIALMLATFQTSILFFSQQVLETSAEKTARQLVTNQAQNAGVTQANFKTIACSNLPAFMSCSNLFIDVQSASDFSGVTTTTPTLTYDKNGNVTNTWQFSPGAPGNVVVMRMMYLFPVLRGPLDLNFADQQGNKRLLVATEVFKTESYVQ
jgi:Flp pilus assembly protein TadG